MSIASIEMFEAILSVPAFPGATKILSTLELCLSFQTKACSRPPLPITNTFTAHPISFLLYTLK